MRKLLLTALVLGLSVAQAQYYVLSFINEGENPGGLNTEDEQPLAYLTGNYTGYTQVIGTATTGWSTQQTLPFTFNFNGNDYTTYYVDAAGVVTFGTPGSALSSNNVALPDTTIPDNSICAWGMSVAGANDAVVKKTFGTAPNRQEWVIWASASAPELTGTYWTYWGIVMEETSNKIYVVDMRTYSSGGTNVSLSVGLQFDGSNAISLSSSPNTSSGTTATAGNGSDPSDNTYYMFAPGTQPSVDIHLKEINLSKYVAAGATANLTGRIRNLGADPISAFDVEWTDGTNTYTSTITGNVNSGSYKSFTHGTPVDPPAGGVMNITVTAVIANDADLTNNSLSTTCTELAFVPTKVVFGEEATGTWCGWCPRGAVWMEYMAENYPESWQGVAVHNSDPMTNSVYDSWMGTKISGYPSGLIDRDANPADPTEFESRYNDNKDNFAVADLSVDAYLDIDRNLDVTIGAHFAISSTDQWRLAAIITENHMSGTTSQWSQANYYSGGGNGTLSGAGHDWHNEPNPIPYTDMEYDHVGRELLGGIDGDAGSVPSSITADDEVEYTYSTTLDNTYNEENLHIVAILIDNATGLVWNAGGTDVAYEIEVGGEIRLVKDGITYEQWDGNWVPLGTKEINGATISTYPNPASSQLNINGVTGISNVVVYDARGSVVMSTKVDGNSMNISDLPAGVYNFVITNNGVVANEKVTVVK